MQRMTALFWLGSSNEMSQAISDLDSPNIANCKSRQDSRRRVNELHSKMVSASNTELISRIIQLCDDAMQYFEQQENTEALHFIDLFTISVLRTIVEDTWTHSARLRWLSASSSRTLIAQTCLGFNGRFWPTIRPLFQAGRSVRIVGKFDVCIVYSSDPPCPPITTT